TVRGTRGSAPVSFRLLAATNVQSFTRAVASLVLDLGIAGRHHAVDTAGDAGRRNALSCSCVGNVVARKLRGSLLERGALRREAAPVLLAHASGLVDIRSQRMVAACSDASLRAGRSRAGVCNRAALVGAAPGGDARAADSAGEPLLGVVL